MEGLEFGVLYGLQRMHTPWLDSFLVFVTTICNRGEVWIAIGAVLLCFKRTRRTGIVMVIAMVVGYLVGNVWMKNLFQRPRPCWLDPSVRLLVDSPRDFSFPSGHTLVSFEGAFSIWLGNRRWGLAALALAGLIGFSRLYLFVHFPTDVLAGGLLGVGIAWAVHKMVYRIMEKRLQ